MSAIVNFLLGKQLALREGVSESFASRMGLVLSAVGLTPVGLMATVVLSRREGEAVAASESAGVAVPDVSGRKPADATKALETAGFTVSGTVVKEASTTVPSGMVIRTDPAAGGRAPA